VLFTHTDHLPLLRRYMKVKLGQRCSELFHCVQENDLALESCENRLLESVLPARADDRPAIPGQYELFKGFTPAELRVIASLLQRRVYPQSEIIINAGDEASELFFLARGGVSVFVNVDSVKRKRLATFTRGMVFGEMAVIDRAPRSAMIVADSEVTCDVMSRDDFDHLDQSHPGIKIKLLESLCQCLCRRLRTVNRKLAVFD
jgi:CRP-like cAMP-binding protein